jgi:hypothetical protein
MEAAEPVEKKYFKTKIANMAMVRIFEIISDKLRLSRICT